MNQKTYNSVISGKSDNNINFNDFSKMSQYSVFMYYDSQDKIYVASVPELQGCMAHGETREEALKEIEIAEALWLESAKDMGAEIPEPSVSVR